MENLSWFKKSTLNNDGFGLSKERDNFDSVQAKKEKHMKNLNRSEMEPTLNNEENLVMWQI